MKYKVMFFIPSLAGGGAERVFANIINEIDKSTFDVTLVYLSDTRNVYKINNNVNIINLKSNRLRNSPFKILASIRRENPDLIITTHGHMNLLLILLKPFISNKIKLIVRQTNILSFNFSINKIKNRFEKMIFGLLKYSDKIICQSEYMKKDIMMHLKVNEDKIVKIFNPVAIHEVMDKSKEKVDYTFTDNYKYIIFIGRLNEVKNIPTIIDAFEQYYKKVNSKSKLLILGNGPKENELKQLINQKNLKDNVCLLGFQENPYKWLKHSDLFIMASKHEGMPNVLIEALTLEVPVLVQRHPGGTIDIMEALEITDKFLDKLVINDKVFSPYKNDVLLKLRKNFGIEKVVKEYEDLFISMLKET